MKQMFKLLPLIAMFSLPTVAYAEVNVFACEPEWAALSQELGGEKVDAFAATHARQDPHHIRAKPSLIAAMRRADLVVCSGASLEVGWLPILLQKAGNTHTQPGSAGYLMVADIVPVLEKPISIDRANGDVHPEGNPHVQLNPHNIAIAAKAVAERMEALDPENASTYRAHYADFAARWNAAMLRWEQQVANLKGLSVVVHHKSFIYLLDWLGMKEVASLEPKPGLPPTSSHLEGLLQKLKTTPAQLIIRTPYDPDDASQWLSEKTGVPAVVLPYTVGGDVQSGDLFGLFDSTLAALEGATHAER